jgi:hypothetical protein
MHTYSEQQLTVKFEFSYQNHASARFSGINWATGWVHLSASLDKTATRTFYNPAGDRILGIYVHSGVRLGIVGRRTLSGPALPLPNGNEPYVEKSFVHLATQHIVHLY